MERYKVILGYDGTAYHGMQRQANAPTIQGELEAALQKIGWEGSSVLAAGRTDAGVHATGQVAVFDLDWQHTPQDLVNALNATLPPEVAVSEAQVVRPDFHPRFDALSRTYEYQLITQPARHPLRERYAWRIWPVPEVSRLRACATLMVGEHDFAAFGTPPQEGGTTTRRIIQAEWQHQGNALSFVVTANAFLYHMVRRMVYIQVEIGLGKQSLQRLQAALAAPGEMIQGLAPAHGLILRRVDYRD